MGGYGLYVWGSYGVTLVLLAGEVIMIWKRKRELSKRETVPGYERRDPKLEVL